MPDIVKPNRPDAIGFWEDSQVSQKSKYVDAIHRLVARLKDSARGVRQEDIRGKRRLRKKPQDASNTIRMYLKALEIFTYWCQAKFSRELDPDEVTRRVAMDFYTWLSTTEPPDIRGMMVRASGIDMFLIYEAIVRACRGAREAKLVDIYEQLNPSTREKFVFTDSSGRTNFGELHKRLGMLIRDYRWIYRLPKNAALRKETGRISSRKERDPMIYKYIVPEHRTSMRAGTAATYLSGLSAIWTEMLQGDAGPGGEAPLRVNVWHEPARIALRKAREDRRRAKRATMLTHPLSEAVFRAAQGASLEALRDSLALYLLTHACLRSEELVGALRRDLYERNGVLTLSIRSGKGDKTREVPLSNEIRDAMVAFDQILRTKSQEKETDDLTGELVSSHIARYCATLMMHPDAPIVPSLVRWGANEREGVDPEKAALEPLDTSGLRRMLYGLADRARVVDVATGMQRPLNKDERKRIHAHNFRHYGATCAREAGMPLDEIKALLGHESVKTTEGYVHIEPDSVVLIGAYIAKARRGQVMSTEEATRMRQRRGSLLDDERIIASEPVGRRGLQAPASPLQPGAQPRRERVAVSDVPLASPEWAYQKGGDTLKLYLPDPKMTRYDVPKGQGALLTYRIGYASRLPWWMGRANTWSDEQRAPILSHFQTQPETEKSYEVLRRLEVMYERFWRERGPTAAYALLMWIDELLGMVAPRFSEVMSKRGDKWIRWDEPASAGELGVVREHDADHVLLWFETYGHAAIQSVIRRQFNWIPFTGQMRRVDSKTFEVSNTEQNARIFAPGREIKFMGIAKKRGDATGEIQWRHGIVARYADGKVTLMQKEPAGAGPEVREEGKERFVMPSGGGAQRGAKLDEGFPQALEYADTPTWGDYRETRYPSLFALQNVPGWFFDDDPLMSLPAEERVELREWIERLEGTRPSQVRTTVFIDDLLSFMDGWIDAYAELHFWGEDKASAQQRYKLYEDAFATETAKPGRFKEGVTLPMIRIHDIIGGLARYRLEKMRKKLTEKVQAGKSQEQAISEIRSERFVLEESEEPPPAPPPGVTLETGNELYARLINFLILRYGIDIRAGVRVERVRLFSGDLLTFDPKTPKAVYGPEDANTIRHDAATKERFRRMHGTDSECVVRRIVRSLWERHKASRLKRGHQEHHDVIRRHFYAWLSFVVPCPSVLESQLRMSHPEMASYPADRIKERVAALWTQTIDLIRSDLGEHVALPKDITAERAVERVVGEPIKRRAQEEAALAPEPVKDVRPEYPKPEWETALRELEIETATLDPEEAEERQYEWVAQMLPTLRTQRDKDEFGKWWQAYRAKPNASRVLPIGMPNPVRLLFAEYWIV